MTAGAGRDVVMAESWSKPAPPRFSVERRNWDGCWVYTPCSFEGYQGWTDRAVGGEGTRDAARGFVREVAIVTP